MNSFPLLAPTQPLTFQCLPAALLIILYLEIGLVIALLNQSRRLWLRNLQLHISIIHISFKSYRFALPLCWMFSRIISVLPHVSHHAELSSVYNCTDSGIVRDVLAALGTYATSRICQNESATTKEQALDFCLKIFWSYHVVSLTLGYGEKKWKKEKRGKFSLH